MSVYRFAQRLATTLWPLVGRLDVQGLENVPEHGPFILVANHQSILDPILIQAVCPRPLHTMAKSTQFAAPFLGWLMARHLHAYPARRYDVDPQAVRIALRRLHQGHGVGIYPEGERSWDGRLQPLRLGAVRLILKAGVPVVPTTIQGSHDVWPRWGGLRRSDIRIQFMRPIRFPATHGRAERERLLPHALETLQAAISPAG